MKVALIGSARFEQDWIDANKELTLLGHVVYSLGAFPSQQSGKNWYNDQQKVMLDMVHLRKVHESDAVVLLDRDGYVGESTFRELTYSYVFDKVVVSANSLEFDYKKVHERLIGQ